MYTKDQLKQKGDSEEELLRCRTMFEALKKELLANVRADWKKQRILALTPERLFVLKPHWCFGRIIYHTDGRLTDSSGYTSAQDYNSEIKEVITAIIGKK